MKHNFSDLICLLIVIALTVITSGCSKPGDPCFNLTAKTLTGEKFLGYEMQLGDTLFITDCSKDCAMTYSMGDGTHYAVYTGHYTFIHVYQSIGIFTIRQVCSWRKRERSTEATVTVVH